MLLGSALSVLCLSPADAGQMVSHHGGQFHHFTHRGTFRIELGPPFFTRHFGDRRFSRFLDRSLGFGPFFGGELVDGFDDFGVAAPPVFAGSLMPPPLAFPPPPPRRLASERATVETEQGVQIVRGPGSHHLLR
jgi:hypothetical protein